MDRATGCRPVVSNQCTMSAVPQLCVCVFIRGDSSTQWNKDTVNHNQMGVWRGWWGEGTGNLRRLGEESVYVPRMFRGMPRPNVGH